jgi:hypothetical protein
MSSHKSFRKNFKSGSEVNYFLGMNNFASQLYEVVCFSATFY